MEKEITININDVIYSIHKRKKVILLTLFVSLILGIIFAFFTKPPYKVESNIYIEFEKEVVLQDPKTRYTDAIYIFEKYVRICSKLLNSDSFIRASAIENNIAQNEIDRIKKKIKISPSPDSQVINISFEHENKNVGVAFLNSLINHLRIEIKNINPDIKFLILDKPYATENISNSSNAVKILIALVLGLFLVFLYIFIFDFLMYKIKSANEISDFLQIHIIGQLKINKEKDTDDFKLIRNNLLTLLSRKNAKVISFISIHKLEGKSYIANNISKLISDLGYRTLLIDFSRNCNENNNSLTVVRYFKDNNFTIDKEEIMKIKKFVETQKEEYDYIFFDMPSVFEENALLLNEVADASILVTAYDEITLNELNELREIINIHEINLIGLIFNKVFKIMK
ncbi:Chain length determinant protein [Caloramator mitchellensis]|uniref:Chain length determinant protein n=1 Tax=Caloramator mitchellensis TaxID=908809 RepID=A0A0R3K0S4_CALMK|nr:hypothetical protein [Caloramator mitchellensis]KRQ85871.1 Chain length determinant protein [Caloramator mitchellensis]